MQDNRHISQKQDILNIRETVERCKLRGIPLSEYTLRRALKSGALPCRMVGRTYLISWANVERWLSCEDGADNGAAVRKGTECR